MRVRGYHCRIVLGAVAASGLAGWSAAPAHAAYSLTSTTTPVTDNFDSFAGSAATVPSNITLGGGQAAAFNGLFTGGSSAYSTANGVYAGTQTANAADRSIAARVPAGSDLTATFTVTNNTGSTIQGLSISYNVEQYQDAVATPNFINLLSNNGSGSTFNATNLSGGTSTQELKTVAAGSETVYATPLSVARTAFYNQPIANGASVQFQFQWVPGGSGNRPIWGVDDLSIAVPEPTAAGALALAGIGLLARRRRRQG